MGKSTKTNGQATKAVEEKPQSFSFQIDFPVAEVLGRDVKDAAEAEAFQALVNQFYSSDIVFGQLVAFVQMWFEQAKKDLKAKKTGLILPN